MAKYAYKATNKKGEEVFGIVEADTQALAINDVRGLGLYPTSIREARRSDEKRARKKKKGLNDLYFGGVKTKQLVVMTRQLSTLIDAGLPLLRSINVLVAQLKPCKLRDILDEISADIQGGSTFSEALAKHPRQFDRLFVNMVRAGEVGGMLEVVLNRLAIFMEKRQALKNRVKGAMIYPIFVIIFASGIVLFLLTYIVPTFAEVLGDFGGEMPWMTQFLINLSNYLKYEWWKLLVYINGTIIAFKFLFKIPQVRTGRDWLVLRIPLVGDLITKVAVARFTRTLGTLITSGVPILQSLRITQECVGNVMIERAVGKVHDSIKEGDTIAAPLDEAKVFPTMVVNMIDVGEETGSLDAMLIKVADIYDTEVEVAVDSMLRLMEPALIVILGFIIGFIVVAMYLPILTLADSISGA